MRLSGLNKFGIANLSGGGGTAQPSDVAAGKSFTNDSGTQTGTSTAVTVNGIIQSYLASSSGNISAGDFVKFIDTYSYNHTIEGITNSGQNICAVALSSTSVFIAHSYGTGYNLYGMVCTTDGVTITPGIDTMLLSTSQTGHSISVTALSPTSVFILYNDASSSPNCLNSIVCTISSIIISGTAISSITPGTATTITSGNWAPFNSCVALSATSVFLAYSSMDSNYQLKGRICTISGTSIALGPETTLNTTQYSCYDSLSIVALSSTSVFIAHGYNVTYQYLYSVVCTVSGSTITPGSDVSLSATQSLGISCSATILRAATEVFVAANGNSGLHGIICTISGTTISTGADTVLMASSSAPAVAATISPTAVFIVYGLGTYAYLHGMICTINKTTITAGTDIEINGTQGTGYPISLAALSGGVIFITNAYQGGANYYYYLMVSLLTRCAQTISSVTDPIAGIATTSASANSAVNVSTPNL